MVELLGPGWLQSPQEEAGSQGATWARGDRWWLRQRGELRQCLRSQARPGGPCEWARGLSGWAGKEYWELGSKAMMGVRQRGLPLGTGDRAAQASSDISLGGDKSALLGISGTSAFLHSCSCCLSLTVYHWPHLTRSVPLGIWHMNVGGQNSPSSLLIQGLCGT